MLRNYYTLSPSAWFWIPCQNHHRIYVNAFLSSLLLQTCVDRLHRQPKHRLTDCFCACAQGKHTSPICEILWHVQSSNGLWRFYSVIQNFRKWLCQSWLWVRLLKTWQNRLLPSTRINLCSLCLDGVLKCATKFRKNPSQECTRVDMQRTSHYILLFCKHGILPGSRYL